MLSHALPQLLVVSENPEMVKPQCLVTRVFPMPARACLRKAGEGQGQGQGEGEGEDEGQV